MKYYFNDISTTPAVFYLLILMPNILPQSFLARKFTYCILFHIFYLWNFDTENTKNQEFRRLSSGEDQRGARRGEMGWCAVPRELSYLFGNNVGNNGTLPSHVTQSW